MKNLLISAFVTAFLLGILSCSKTVAEDPSPGLRPEPMQALAKAEEHYAKRISIDEAKKAVSVLAPARDPENRNFEVEWKFAQFSYFVGSRDEVGDEEAEKYLKEGISAAKIAKRMEPKKPDGHFWYAAILGEQAKRSPVTVGVVSIGKIKEAMETVISIDPGYQGASAYDGLGQLEMGSRGLTGGSLEKAIEYYEKAYELNKDNTYIRLHLGEAYTAAGKKAEGKKLLESVLSAKAAPGFEAEYEESVREAKKLLKDKF